MLVIFLIWQRIFSENGVAPNIQWQIRSDWKLHIADSQWLYNDLSHSWPYRLIRVGHQFLQVKLSSQISFLNYRFVNSFRCSLFTIQMLLLFQATCLLFTKTQQDHWKQGSVRIVWFLPIRAECRPIVSADCHKRVLRWKFQVYVKMSWTNEIRVGPGSHRYFGRCTIWRFTATSGWVPGGLARL